MGETRFRLFVASHLLRAIRALAFVSVVWDASHSASVAPTNKITERSLYVTAVTPSLPLHFALYMGQSRALCPDWPHLWQTVSFGQSRAKWPGWLQFLQTAWFLQSRAMCPGWRQLRQTTSLGQSRAMWPSLLQLRQMIVLDPLPVGRLVLSITRHNQGKPFLRAVGSNVARLAAVVADRFRILVILIGAITSNMTEPSADIAFIAACGLLLASYTVNQNDQTHYWGNHEPYAQSLHKRSTPSPRA